MTLQDRIEAAIKRIKDGSAPMRIPVDLTDPDVVLAECGKALREAQEKLNRYEGAVTALQNDKAEALLGVSERENQLRARIQYVIDDVSLLGLHPCDDGRCVLCDVRAALRKALEPAARAALSPIPAGNLWCNNHNLERTEPGPECPKCVTERRSPIPATEELKPTSSSASRSDSPDAISDRTVGIPPVGSEPADPPSGRREP